MHKIKSPFTSPKGYIQSANELIEHLRPSVHKVGTAPGTLTYTGKHTVPTQIRLFQFDKNNISIEPIENIDDLKNKLSKKNIKWIEVVGFQDIDLITKLGTDFQIDQLTLEDILNISQIPKVEGHDNYLFITLKMVLLKNDENMFQFTHCSLIVKDNLLITFSEKSNSIFNNLESQLQNGHSKLQNTTVGHLSYRIVDTIVDQYYTSLEWFANMLAELEIELVENPSKKHIHTILNFKKKWMILRKTIYPIKDAIKKMLNIETEFIDSAGKHYVEDLHDHLQSIVESMEIIRASLDNLMDLYTSTESNKMNEVMQVLTIVSTVFIPLTFIAGIYGMNFVNMPELEWKNGYFYTLGVMLVVSIIMLLYVKRKRWL